MRNTTQPTHQHAAKRDLRPRSLGRKQKVQRCTPVNNFPIGTYRQSENAFLGEQDNCTRSATQALTITSTHTTTASIQKD